MSSNETPGGMQPRFVGARVQRREDPRLLTGQGRYVDDRHVPNLVHVAFRRSDHAHARIDGIDTSTAAAMPGVLAVFTGADLAGLTNPVQATSRMADYQPTWLPPLAVDRVRYVGEPVVAIVAEDRYLAEDAVAQVEVAFDTLAPVVDVEEAIQDGAPRLHDEATSNVLALRQFGRGDVEAAMAEATVKVGGRFRFRRKSPLAMENRAYLAEYDRGARALTLYSSTQVPGIIRDIVAEILDMPGHRVRIVAPDVGGGFGGKTSLYMEEVVVCALTRHLGRPVKWTGDRQEDLRTTYQAFDETIDAELALDADGAIVGLRADVIGDVGAYSVYPWTAAIEPVQVVSFLPGPYRVINYDARVRSVATSKPPGGPYRGVGRPISTFVMERLIDMAARRLELDPAELRRRNLITADEFPFKTASGIVWDRSAFIECLDNACSAIGYEDLRAEQREARAQGRWMGIGIASYSELTGIGSRISAAPGMPINTGTESATVQIDSTGAVSLYTGAASQGQGLETTLAQVVADALDAPVQDVDVFLGDTTSVAHGTGTYASRSAVLAGGGGDTWRPRPSGTRSSRSPRICSKPRPTTSTSPAARSPSPGPTGP